MTLLKPILAKMLPTIILQVQVVVASFGLLGSLSSLECSKVVIANVETATFVSLHILPLLACFESVLSLKLYPSTPHDQKCLCK